MSKKKIDDLPVTPVKVEGVKAPKPATEYLEEYYKTLGDGTLSLIGVKTGFKELDDKTLGLDGLIVLGGIAGQGKTSLALQLAFEVCRLGTPTLFYSLEMPKRAILTKILNRLAKVSYADILLKGRQYLDKERQNKNPLDEALDFYKLLSKEEAKNLDKAKGELAEVGSRFYLRSRESGEDDINFANLEKEINAVKAEHKTDKVFVVIDHLQVFNVDGYKDQIDKEGKLITGFKGISERTGATILLIAQKNKAGMTYKGGLQTIKGSVDIVYLADVVMFLESEGEGEREIDGHKTTKDITLLIEKNRYNAPSKLNLKFNGKYSDFEFTNEFDRL